MLLLDRRKCLLLTHAATLFSVFEPDVRVSPLRSTREFVSMLLARELQAESLPADAFGETGTDPLVLAKTSDRSVIGCMNDMAFLAEISVDQSGGLAALDPRELNHRLRRTINSTRDHRRPIDLVRERLLP